MLGLGAIALATTIFVIGCGGSAADTATPAGSAPTSQAPSTPTAAPPTATPQTAQPSVGIPSIAIPGSTSDLALAARFPTEIDGQPVSDVRTLSLIEVLALSPHNVKAKFSNQLAAIGLDANSMSYSLASVTLSDQDVHITAIATGGPDAGRFMEMYPALDQLFRPDKPLPTLSDATLGGKDITQSTDSDGQVAYVYIAGDIVWAITRADESAAAAVLAALP